MKKRNFLILLALLPALVVLAVPAQATIVTLTDQNSTAVIDTTSASGMYSWVVDGVPQLFQQWFWYRIGESGGEQGIEKLGIPTELSTGTNQLKLTYANASLTVDVIYSLLGAPLGSGTSDMGEQISLKNNTSQTMSLHFFQYSDFDLGGTPDNDTVNIGLLGGDAVAAIQTDPSSNFQLTESITTVAPLANRWEAGYYPDTLNSLGDADPTTLANTLTASGDVTWAFQWDLTIGAGNAIVISKNKVLEMAPVPEPAAILGLGTILLLVGRKLSRKLV